MVLNRIIDLSQAAVCKLCEVSAGFLHAISVMPLPVAAGKPKKLLSCC
jgi:hypothetical protein